LRTPKISTISQRYNRGGRFPSAAALLHQRRARMRQVPAPASSVIMASNIQRASTGTLVGVVAACTTMVEALELLLFGVGSGWSLLALAVLTTVLPP
jgi:hypothetical protein